MHRALLEPVITFKIVGYLYGEEHHRDVQSCVSFSLVCRAFYWSSRPQLWRDLIGLGRLMTLMPSHVKGKSNVNLLRGIPNDRDWACLKVCAAYVENLIVSLGDGEQEDLAALQNLSLYRSSSLLLPNLHRLDIIADTDEGLCWTSLLLSSSLEVMVLRFDGPAMTPQCVSSFIGCLDERTPSLTSLELHGGVFSDARVQSSLVQVTHHLPCFYRLDFGENCIILQLGTLLALAEGTELQLLRMNRLEGIFVSSAVTHFEHLRYLAFSGPHAVCAALMDSVRLPVLQALHLAPDSSVSNVAILHLTQMLKKHCPSLQELVLKIGVPGSAEGPQLSAASFSPLYACHKLVSISIQTVREHSGPLWNDDDILRMAWNWQNLQHLDLCSDWNYRVVPRITLAGLLPLRIHCRSLRSLHLSINLKKSTWLPDACLRSSPPVTTPVTILLGRSSIRPNDERASSFISEMWPNALLLVDKSTDRYMARCVDGQDTESNEFRHAYALKVFCDSSISG